LIKTEKTIAIVGGGITGMAAAHAAQTLLPDFKILLIESSERLGGVLQTENVDGYLIEKSADMFTTDPPFAMELCHQLGKQDEIIQTTPTTDRAFVATRDAIHPVPRGFSLMSPGDIDAVLGSPLLDAAGKQRFLDEQNIASNDWSDDESLESFAVRRFGQSAFDNLIQPLVSGIYTADPKKLSMKATMARFVDMELGHGSLIRAAANSKQATAEKEASGARYGLFRAPRQGIGQLVDWIKETLTGVEIRTGCAVESISKSSSGWGIELKQGGLAPEPIDVDGIVLATPARVSAELLQISDAALAQKLSSIEAASSAIVVLGVDQSQLREPFAGYGIIVPSVLNRQVIATSFSSNKFAGRAPDGKLLIRCFIGGALQSDLVDLADKDLVDIATKELDATVGLTGSPELSRVYRWRNCMPQYHLGHLDRVAEIETLTAMHPGLELAGNSYRGVGIPACIQSGSESVERLVQCFADR
jgi:oxygen-dependent protoporphyrinogen oxidase